MLGKSYKTLLSLNWNGDGSTDDNININSLKEDLQINIWNHVVIPYPW